jgi:hypothetical protein
MATLDRLDDLESVSERAGTGLGQAVGPRAEGG